MKRLLLSALLAVTTAHAAPAITPTLRIPGAAQVKLTEQDVNLMSMSLFTARNLLSGIDSGDLTSFPCLDDDGIVTLLDRNDVTAYTAVRTALKSQGWTTAQEVRSPIGEATAFRLTRGNVNLMGMWMKNPDRAATRSRLALCQLKADWKPRPAPADAALSAPAAGPLGAALRLTIPNWFDPAGVLYGTVTRDDTEHLAVRGTINRRGEATLTLARPPAPTLRSAANWPAVFLDDNCTSGVTVSNPQAQLAAVDTLLFVPLNEKATDRQILKAGETTSSFFLAERYQPTESAYVTLVYASAQVTLRGTAKCPSGTRQVNLNLPAGWSVIYRFQSNGSDGAVRLVNAPAQAATQYWDR